MRRRVRSGDEEEQEERKPAAIEVAIDSATESIVLAAEMVDPEARAWLATALRPENFLVEENRHLHAALQEVHRRKLDFDLALVAQFAGERVPDGYAAKFLELRPEAPSRANLEHFADRIRWDYQRALAMRGPLAGLVEALRKNDPAERVRALARQTADSFAGAGKSYLADPRHLVATQLDAIRKRMAGEAFYSYGIDALDRYEAGYVDEQRRELGGRQRMIPGTKPGMVTVLTSRSQGGKSTLAARMALGIARCGRKVLYGAWEPGGGMTLELIAAMSLSWSRTDLAEGNITHEDLVLLEERMHALSEFITFMENPFQRSIGGQRESNERNLDVVQQHIVDSGCEVFFADLWDRCCVEDKPSDEKRALWRQHGIAEETQTHNILLAQQKQKGEGARVDGFPTGETIKGSGTWMEMPETVLAPYRPALYKRVPDDKVQIVKLKDRFGPPPCIVEFDWDAEFGTFDGGVTLPFDRFIDDGAGGAQLEGFKAPEGQGGKRKRR